MPSGTEKESVIIVGGGIIGLFLALSLKQQVGVSPVVYEETEDISNSLGSGLIMYPNGLRVVRDLNMELLLQIREAGHVFRDQRWERHDGTETMAAHDAALSHDDENISSLGIRRDILHKLMYNAVTKAGIKVNFGKSIASIISTDEDSLKIDFLDGTSVLTQVLLGTDGIRSTVRQKVWKKHENLMKSLGVTAIMGLAHTTEDQKDLCFPSCEGKSHCHAVYFPTSLNEECFQLFLHDENDLDLDEDYPGVGSTMTPEYLKKVAAELKQDGWHERYWQPIDSAAQGFKTSFATLSKPLSAWVNGRVALVGDAAHPPVPYLGQGAQMGFEDVGVLSTLLKMFCSQENDDGNNNTSLDLSQWDKCMTLYQEIRMKRVAKVVQLSHSFGEMEDSRTASTNKTTEMVIRADILMNGTLPMLEESADHDYMDDVRDATSEEKNKDPIDPSQCLQALEELMGMSNSDLIISPTSRVLAWNRKSKVNRQQAREALEALEGLMG